MSSILEALEKKKKSQTTEVSRADSLPALSSPPSIRARRKMGRIIVPLVAIPLVIGGGLAVLKFYPTLTFWRAGTIEPSPQPIQLVRGDTDVPVPEPIVDEGAERPAEGTELPGDTGPTEPPVTTERTGDEGTAGPVVAVERPGGDEQIEKLNDELATLRSTLNKLLADANRRAESPKIVQPPKTAWVPPAHEGSPSQGDVKAGGDGVSTVEPGPSDEGTTGEEASPDSGTADEGETPTGAAVEGTGEDTTVPADETGEAPTSTGRKAGPDIKLEGIAAGPEGPCAIIDGQMLEVGDIYEEWEITEIGDGYIRVDGWDRKIYLH
jgi:hypothetical protein